MAYNPYYYTNKILDSKGQWIEADKAGDTVRKNNIATKAQEYYNSLRNNGYADVANQLTSASYDQAKAINDKWNAFGKTKTRDHFYNLGKSKGMTQKEIDDLISYDDVTKEVSFGGKSLGRADAYIDGTSYWGDTSKLDNAFNEYITNTNTVPSEDKMYEQTMQSGINKNNQQWDNMQKNASDILESYRREYDDLKTTNPFETETAKAILAKYDLAGLQGRDNAVASGSKSNGGNIDSFSAANALRQQAALVNQGQMVVLDEYKQRLDHAQNILNNLGLQMSRDYADQNMNIQTDFGAAQQLFNNSETRKNSDVARKSEIASVTGYTPTEWSIQNDAFLKNFVDENGNLRPEYNNTDFQGLINLAKSQGNSELANKYAILRGLKIFGNFNKYGKYLESGDIAYIQPQQTEAAREFDKQVESAERIAKTESEANLAAINAQTSSNERISNTQAASNEHIARIEAQNNLDQIHATGQYGGLTKEVKPKLTAEQAATAIKNGETSQAVLDAYNYYYGTTYTPDSPPGIAGGAMSDKDVKWWVDHLNKQADMKYPGKTAVDNTGVDTYKPGDVGDEWVIIKVLESDTLTDEQKKYLLCDKFGISIGRVNAAIHDPHYRNAGKGV